MAVRKRFFVYIGVFIAFSALSLAAVLELGYFGVWAAGFRDIPATQILVDLIIMSFIMSMWMIPDAKKYNITVWPFLLGTLITGSLAPLSYLIYKEWVKSKQPTQNTREEAETTASKTHS